MNDIQLAKLYYALSALFTECIARHLSATCSMSHAEARMSSIELGFGIVYLPAAYAEKEAQHVGLLLLMELLDIFQSTHLRRY